MRWTDEGMERTLGFLLLAGVIFSAMLVLTGGLIFLILERAGTPHFGTFLGEPESLSTIGGIIRGACRLNARSLIQLGIVLLIATPVLRVAVSLAGFLLQRDKVYVIVTLIVLTVLLFSFISPV